MHHDVFYLGKILLDRVMHPFRDAVRLPERLAAVHPDLDIHIDLIAKNPRMQKVYALHTILPGGALPECLLHLFAAGLIHRIFNTCK